MRNLAKCAGIALCAIGCSSRFFSEGKNLVRGSDSLADRDLSSIAINVLGTASGQDGVMSFEERRDLVDRIIGEEVELNYLDRICIVTYPGITDHVFLTMGSDFENPRRGYFVDTKNILDYLNDFD